jgi:hypothetical protein
MSMPGKIRQVVPLAVGESESRADAFRERIALRCEEQDARFPRAVALEARVLDRAHRELRGAIEPLRGIHSFNGFYDRVMGSKRFYLADLCRLATEPTREARTAVRAILSEIAAEIGEQLSPMKVLPLRDEEVIARVAETSGTLVGESVRARADGVYTEDEIASLERRNDALKAAAAQMDTVLAQAKAGLR